jgi:hypothetical protein
MTFFLLYSRITSMFNPGRLPKGKGCVPITSTLRYRTDMKKNRHATIGNQGRGDIPAFKIK